MHDKKRMFLSTIEISYLNQIRETVINGIPVTDVMKACDRIKPSVHEDKFVYTYAGCLLASQERIEEAKQLFSLNDKDIFSSIMFKYLDEFKVFEPAGKVFKSALPYDIFSRTDFFQIHQARAVQNVKEIIRHIPPPLSASPVSILDIGPGNGSLITNIVNEIASLYQLRTIRLVFVDPFEDMLTNTSEYCRENIRIDTEIVTVCCKIQDISDEQVNAVMNTRPIWFVNAALSVHHMPWEQKIPMLRQLKEFSSHLFLTEVDWNHDLPEKDSPELIYSIATNYGIFCKDIFKLPVSEEDKKLCLYHFPISEAINIIKQQRPDRIDYHTPISEWKKIAVQAGYLAGEAMPTYFANGKVFAFTMELRAD